MIVVRVNKYIDLLDRTMWTFLVTLPATLVVFGFNDWKGALIAAGLSSALTATKAKGAQELGGSPIGDAVPGKSVLERTRENK